MSTGNQLLATIMEEQYKLLEATQQSQERPFAFPNAADVIKVAIGMRRTGKTYFLYQCMRELINKGIAEQRILYINFEDERLLPLDAKKMGNLVDGFYTLYPDNHDEMCYLFFDEVQNVEDWPLVVRRLHDKKQVQIYLTGSSAKLLSKEIASSLRGRSIALEVWPYRFSEFIAVQQIAMPKKPYGRQAMDILQHHLLVFLEKGGFPGVQHYNELEWRTTLQSYVDTVVLRDIIERHKVTNIALMKYFISMLLKNCGSFFSINKFYHDIKSQGYKVSKDTLYNYLEYVEDAYLLFAVPIFTESLRKSQTALKKIYAIDTGLVSANIFSSSDKKGSLLENLVYLDLRRRGDEIYYYKTKEGYEVDFLSKTKEGRLELTQVTWSLEDAKTAERERRALESAEKELGIKGKIIDLDYYLRHFS